MQPFQFLKNLIPSMCSILVSLFGRVPLRTVPSTMVKVKVAQSCPTLCDPMDYTEWVAFPFSRGSSQPRDRTKVSHIAGRLFIS